ncbi:unnamed protein product [Lactuca virosa]|uniref:Helitron helicase-like domain-containing protein n=1 Tax=Lactuca virosa TaxID=75947 RepID=A0AAU9N5U9_9ASTR|nr:unnamed protein product [Lactuca virosa]
MIKAVDQMHISIEEFWWRWMSYAFSTNHHKSRTLSSSNRPYYTFYNAIKSTNSSTITHSYSSKQFSPAVHNLKEKSANVSPIRIFDLTTDDDINASNIIQSTHIPKRKIDSVLAKEQRKLRKLYLDNRKFKNKSTLSNGQTSSATPSVNTSQKVDVFNRRQHLNSSKKFTHISSQKENVSYDKTPQRHSTNLQSPSNLNSRTPLSNISNGCLDHGDQNVVCELCHAKLWKNEASRGNKTGNNIFSLCCGYGKVELPPLKEPPQSYKQLYHAVDSKSKYFMKNIRRYNSVFSFTSMGGKVDSSINRGNASYIFRLSGQNYHSIGSLLPSNGCQPRFSQLYIYDTENETSNRQKCLWGSNHPSTSTDDSTNIQIIEDLKLMLDSNNELVKCYRMVRDVFNSNPHADLKLRIIGKRQHDGRTYNLPTASEVVALIVGDIGDFIENRDIVVQTSSGALRRISELHPSYLALQYPLLFPYGDDGYRVDIPHRGVTSSSNSKRPNTTMREFFAYRIQDRDNSFSLILNSRRLFQQFLVDGYTMIESERLYYVRKKQKVLRCESYENLSNFQHQGNKNISEIGQRVILPSSFTGGALYMMQNYLDAMSLFVYTIEFQKRGLPHSHICLFMQPDYKLPTVEHIHQFISAEITSIQQDPALYSLVKEFTIHGPCGAQNVNCPCKVDNKCSKNFPKNFSEHTSIDENDFPIYRRKNDGSFVEKSGVQLDNRNVVPYNKYLLKRYQAHINVEWCNQGSSIKYLSACEASWRIYGYDVHYRHPSVMRLPFHLPNQQQVVYGADDDIDNVLNQTSVASSMFTSWMECNKVYKQAKKN